MKLLFGPSEAHRAKNATFKQSYWPIVVVSRQGPAGLCSLSHRICNMTEREELWRTSGNDSNLGGHFPKRSRPLHRATEMTKHTAAASIEWRVSVIGGAKGKEGTT